MKFWSKQGTGSPVNKFRGIICLLFSFLFLLSFSSIQQIKLKDGARFIHNDKQGKWGVNSELSLNLIRTVGGIDVEDENLAFRSPYDIAFDPADNMYILDLGNNRIQKFSPEGKYMATIGRYGQGPGEFNRPNSIDFDQKGNLYVSDRGNRRIQVLTPKGKASKTIKITKYSVNKIRYLKSGLLAMGGLTGLAQTSEKNAELPKLMQVLNMKGKLKYEFGKMLDYKDNLENHRGNWVHFEVDQNGYFYLTFRHQNRIEKYSPEGKLVWRADRVLNYTTGVLKKGYIQKKSGNTIIQSPLMNTVSSGIGVDDKGRVWVLTLKRQLTTEERGNVISVGRSRVVTKSSPEDKKLDVYKLEIFDPEGILLGEIHLDHHAHGMRIYKNHLFIWERNNAKYYQYEIIEK